MTTSLGRLPRPGHRQLGRGGLILGTLVLVVVVGGGAFGAYTLTARTEPVSGGTVVEGLVVDGPLVLLPPFAPNQNSTDVASLLDRGLVRLGDDGRPLPELASKWEVDQSSKTFTFHMRPDLQWSDGVPLTSGDALYTLSVLQQASLAQTLTGQAWSGVRASAPDAHTVVYTLPSPSSAFISLTTIGLIPEHFLKPRPPASLPAILEAPSSGPFRYDSSDRDHVNLRRNPRSLEHARLDSLQLRRFNTTSEAVDALLAGEIDALAQLTPYDAKRIAGTPNRKLLRTSSFAYVQVLFNQKREPLSDGNVRKAVARSIERKRMVNGVLRGFARLDGSPIPPGISWASAADVGPAFDPRGAQAQLDGDGWTRPRPNATRAKGGHDLALRLLVSDIEPYPTLARQVKFDLAGIGIRVDLKQQPEGQLVDTLARRDFDMALTAVNNGPDPDIYALWHSSEEGTQGSNFSDMPKNPFLDKDLEDGRFSSDIKVRHDAYADAQKILREDQAAAFLYTPDQLLGYSNRVQGIRLNRAMDSGQRFEFVQDWYVKTRRVH